MAICLIGPVLCASLNASVALSRASVVRMPSAARQARRPGGGCELGMACALGYSVPVSVIYFDDFCVDAHLSLGTAASVGNLTHWVTNQYEHDGIRQDAAVFKRLVQMVADRGGPIKE